MSLRHVQLWVRQPRPPAARRLLLPAAVFALSCVFTLWLAVSPPGHWLLDAGAVGVSLLVAWLVSAIQAAGLRAERLVASRTAELDASRASGDAIAERLRLSEQRFRNLFESIGDAIIVTDTARRIQMVNPAMLRTFGYSGEGPLLGQLSAVTYADNEMFEAAGRQIQANADGRPITIDARFRRANGETFPAELRLCYLHDDAGEVAGYIGVIRDSSEREAAAAALRESEIFARAIFDNSPVAIHVLDEDGYSLRMNEAFRDLMGLPGTDFGVGQFNVLTNGFFNRVGLSARFRQAYAGEVVEIQDASLELEDDDLASVARAQIAYDLTLFPIPAPGGGVRAVVAFARDISERKAADAARRAAEERLRLVLANLPVRVFAADTDGVVTFADGRLTGISGLEDEAITGQPVESVFAALPALLAPIRRALAGERFREQVEHVGRIYEGQYSPIATATGAPAGLVWMYGDVTEREQAERARQESQANFTALIENTGDYMWSVRPGYALLSANSAFLGAVRERIGRDLVPGDSVIHERFSDDEKAEWRAHYDRAFAGERFGIERQAVMPDGSERTSDIRFNPIRDAAGAVIGATIVSHDITEAKEAERALRENEERYRKTVENLHDVFYQTSMDDEFVFVSPSALKLHGYTPEEMIGTKARDLFVDPADQAGLIAELAAGRKVNDYEARMRCKDGTIIWVSINAKLIGANGVATGVQGTTRDITDRRRAEQSIRESEERYRKTFEGLHDVFYQTDAAGLLTMVSPSCLRHTGYTPEELVGQPVRSLFANEDRFTEIVSALAHTDTLNDQEAALRIKGGGAAPVSVNATALRDADGALLGYEGTLRDIAERKRAEEELDRVFNLTVDLLAVVAPGGVLLRVNPAWQATLGYTDSELLGTRVWDLIHPDDLAEARHGARAVDRGEVVKDLRARFRCKDGAWKWLGWSMTRAEGKDAIYCVARDVSDLMRAEAETRRAQEDLEETLEAMRASQAVLEEQAEAMDRMRIEAEHLANHDMLTGVANRRAWFAAATAAKPTAIAIFDIDYFKRVNDSHGHPAGDVVLVEVSRRLREALPADTLLGRLGGEEFGALFTHAFDDARAASEAAVRAVANTPIELPDGTPLAVTVSGGLAPWRASQQSRERSLANTYEDADAALYEAKAAGRRQLAVRGERRAA